MIDREQFRAVVGDTFRYGATDYVSVDDLLDDLQSVMQGLARIDAKATVSDVLKLLVDENTH